MSLSFGAGFVLVLGAWSAVTSLLPLAEPGPAGRSTERTERLALARRIVWMLIGDVGLALMVGLGAVVNALNGGTWWAGALASALFVVSAAARWRYARRHGGLTNGSGEPLRSADVTRVRRVVALCLVAVAAMHAPQLLTSGGSSTVEAVVILLCLVLMLGALLAAGWTSVWVTREEQDAMRSDPRTRDGFRTGSRDGSRDDSRQDLRQHSRQDSRDPG